MGSTRFPDGQNEPRAVVLIVDQDLDIRDSLGGLLRDAGYDTVCVAEEDAALQFLRTRPAPAAILLDLKTAASDGKTFREQQLLDPSLAAIPLLVMTSARNVDGEPFGPHAVLFKPFLAEAVLSAIAAATGKRTS